MNVINDDSSTLKQYCQYRFNVQNNAKELVESALKCKKVSDDQKVLDIFADKLKNVSVAVFGYSGPQTDRKDAF